MSNSSLQTASAVSGRFYNAQAMRHQKSPDPAQAQSPPRFPSLVLPVLNQPSEVKALLVSSGLPQYSRNTEGPLTSSSPSFSSNPGVTCRWEERHTGQGRAALRSPQLFNPTAAPGGWLSPPPQNQCLEIFESHSLR